MKNKHRWAAYLWVLQVVTGLALVLYIILHTIDNGMILISQEKFETILALWHGLPGWLYYTMVFGLVLIFVLHMINGIRIASKAYRNADVSWKHLFMLKHQGTYFWFVQVLTGSAVAVFGIWHLIVQHDGPPTTTAAQSAANVTPVVFLIYVLFLAGVMFHSFNGIRSVLLKLGYMTSKTRDAILIGILSLFFLFFFIVGVTSMAKFLPGPENFPTTQIHEEAK